MSRIFHGALCGCALSLPCIAVAADSATGSFRLGEQTITPRHAIAVQAESRIAPGEAETWIYLSMSPFDAMPVAAAFDPDDAVRVQARDEASGSYVKLCIGSDGSECGVNFEHRGPSRNFSTGGYGDLVLATQTSQRVAGRWTLAEPEEFFDETYQFDLGFDVAITPAPGTDLPAGGGEPGKAYQVYLTALAQGDFAMLRKLAGETGAYRFPDDDPTSAKEALKSLRDEQPVIAKIFRGRVNGDEAVLWVEGVDRDEINRQGRVLMKRSEGEWRFEESDLESAD